MKQKNKLFSLQRLAKHAVHYTLYSADLAGKLLVACQ